jgi:uncharacterized protein YjbI with pentapeptide repeats
MKRTPRLVVLVTLSVAIGFLAGFLIRSGYQKSFTGFGEFRKEVPANVKYERAKTLWDWLQLLVIPSVLAVGGFGFQRAMKSAEETRALETQRDTLLQSYLERMSSLVLSEFDSSSSTLSQEQQESKKDRLRNLARAETLSVLSSLHGPEPAARPDQERRAKVVQFLLEGGFICGDGYGIEEKKPFVQLRGANLRGVPLMSMGLSNVDLRGVDLRDADLRWAKLKESYMDFEDPRRGALDQTKIHPKWQLVWQIHNHRLAVKSLRDQDLRDADLYAADLEDKDLGGTDLRGAILDRAKLKGCELDPRTRMDDKWRTVWELLNRPKDDKTWADVDFSSAGLDGGTFSEYTFRKVNLFGASLSDAALSDSTFEEVILWLAILDSANCYKARFIKCNFFSTKFNGTILHEANFNDADLADCDFTGADLKRATLVRAKLSGAKLVGANLTGADVAGADLTNTDLSWCNFRECQIDDATQLENRWRLVWQLINGRASDIQLAGAKLTHADLRKVDLHGRDLTGADFSQTDLREADLRKADLTKAILAQADLRGAKLTDAKVAEGQLQESCLTGEGPDWHQKSSRYDKSWA